MARSGRLTKFNTKDLADSEKISTFANDDDEPTALAFTDFSKPTPILKGKDAERFIRLMEENERKAKERANIPPTREELERELSCAKMMYDLEKNNLKELEQKINNLEKKLNGKTKEE